MLQTAARSIPRYQHPTVKRFFFNLDAKDDAACEVDFRFCKEDIRRLAKAMKFEEFMIDKYKHKAPGVECLCILLYSLTYPRRLWDMAKEFGRNRCSLSEFRKMALQKVLEHGHTLTLRPALLKDHLAALARAVSDAGCPLTQCWGFIDGTLRPMCRPSDGEEAVFSGHKRCHGLKYQSVVGADGIYWDFQGPYDGRRHDSFLLKESNLMQRLHEVNPEKSMFIYGDGAYYVDSHIIGPHLGSALAPEEKRFNQYMSNMRVSVEWGFANIIRLWAGLNFKPAQKPFESPIADLFRAGVILANCNNILRGGNQISQYFGIAPLLTLEEYLQR